jgi:hypothetical protein
MPGFVTFSQLGRYGRFANQIFQIAGTIGIARKYGLQPVFPLWINHDHKERFGSDEDVEIYKHFVNSLPALPDEILQNENSLLKINVPWGYHEGRLFPSHNFDLNGHMQSSKYFDHCIEEVRHYMTMKEEPSQIVYAIALHARRGDYDDKYHPVLKLGYYTLALENMPDLPVLVFSDDPNFFHQLHAHLCSLGHKMANNLVDLHNLNYLASFALMKKCKHFIIANSSYSAAAAILSESPDKMVVAPKTWFGPAYTNITAKDIYQPKWRVI